MLKAILSLSIAFMSLSSVAMTKPRVDAYIAEKESFQCHKGQEIESSFNNLVREDFKTQSELYKNIMLLEGLQDLTEDQKTLAQIQTALTVGPSLGFLAFTASFAGLSSVIGALGMTMEMTLSEAAFFSLNFLIGSAITYSVSDNIVDQFQDIFGEDFDVDELLAKMRVLATVDAEINNISEKMPKIVRDGEVEQFVDKYVGWVSYNRYKSISSALLEMNKLLKLKAEIIKSLKENIRISCM